MHSVQSNKRSENAKDFAERGSRIRLTFLSISTFLTPPSPSPLSFSVQERE
jgi:hypothetical protein